MILIIILLMIVGLMAFLLHKFYFEPKKLMKWQAEALRKKGYRVLEMDYGFTQPSYLKLYEDKKTSDSLNVAKNQLPKYDVAVINILNKVIIEVCSSLQLTQQFYSKEKTLTSPKDISGTESISIVTGQGLVFSEGDTWKKKRKVLTEVFNFDFIKMLAPRIADICDNVLDKIEADSKTNDKQYKFDIAKYGIGLASTVIIECFFNKSIEGEKIENKNIPQFLRDLIDQSVQVGFDLISLIFGMRIVDYGLRKTDRELKRKIKLYKAWGKKITEKRVEEIEAKIEKGEIKKPSDLLEALVFNRHKDGKESSVYNEKALFDEFNIFFLAGTDTTSNYITTIIYLISLHPRVQENLRKQIEEIMSDDDYSYENLKRCNYLDCILKEATRYYGPANGVFYRVATEDTYLKDVPIKKGVLIGVQTLAFHYSEQYYKNPKEFRPQRWLEQCDNLPPYAVGGFSAGPRTCIGKHLAKIQAKIALIKFYKRYTNIDIHKKDISQIKFKSALVYKAENFQSTLVKH